MQYAKKMNSEQKEHVKHLQLAREQSAMHVLELALMRWTSGNTYTELQLAQALRPTPQARWHNAVQLNFKAWLVAGGFAANADATAPEEAPELFDSGARRGPIRLPA